MAFLTFGAQGIGGVSVLDASSGAVLRSVALPANPFPTEIAVDERRDRVYVTSQGPMDLATSQPSGAGSLYVFDARGGRLLRTLPLCVAPIALAVDEQTGHVIVLNSGGEVRESDPWDWLRRGVWFLQPQGRRTSRNASVTFRMALAYSSGPASISVLDPAR